MDAITNEDAKKKVWELIRDIRICLLVTQDASDALHARPMAAMNDDFSGVLWFFTSENSPKLSEIAANPQVLLSYAKPESQHYVSIRGSAEVSKDREMIHQLWKEAARVWFPKGKDDPDITLIKVTVENAEYWDGPSSTFLHIYGYVKARVTGERPEAGDNKKVDFG